MTIGPFASMRLGGHATRWDKEVLMLSEQSIILDVTSSDGKFESRFLKPLGHPVLVCHDPIWVRRAPF